MKCHRSASVAVATGILVLAAICAPSAWAQPGSFSEASTANDAYWRRHEGGGHGHRRVCAWSHNGTPHAPGRRIHASPRGNIRAAARGARTEATYGTHRANGLDFAYLERGEGPSSSCCTGFLTPPCLGATRSGASRRRLSRGGALLARLFTTEIPRDGFYDGQRSRLMSLNVQALGGGPAHLIGQDWGASIGYAVLAAFPELVCRAVLMAVPHPAQSSKSFLDPKHVHRSFHWWFFQLPDLPEKAIVANDFAFIDYLWNYWSSRGYQDSTHLPRSKTCSRSRCACGNPRLLSCHA